jgi:ribosome-associated protein
MDIRKLQRAIVDGLEDVKAQNIAVFNTEHLSSMFERVIIASGASNRQTRALASSVRGAVKSAGLQVLRTEGEDNGEWIIVDCGAAVVHVMQPAIRDYYHLEEIWGGKNVNMKLGGKATGLVKASEPEAEPPKRRAAARPAAPDTGVDKPSPRAAARSAEARKGAGPAPAPTRTVARPAAKKAAPQRFQVGAGKAPAKAAGAIAGKTPARTIAKAPAKSTGAKPAGKIKTLVVGKPVAKKAAAKTTPARKKVVARKGPVTKVASRR